MVAQAGVDTSTPAGKMVFTVLGAVADLERSLIVERFKAGLRNARVKGKRLGRPRVSVDARKIARLRTEGHSWCERSTHSWGAELSSGWKVHRRVRRTNRNSG